MTMFISNLQLQISIYRAGWEEGYYEESHHAAPHYQSIVPLKHNDILQLMADHGGAVGSIITSFIVNIEFYSVSIHISTNIKF